MQYYTGSYMRQTIAVTISTSSLISRTYHCLISERVLVYVVFSLYVKVCFITAWWYDKEFTLLLKSFKTQNSAC